jgi:hypothetical protein
MKSKHLWQITAIAVIASGCNYANQTSHSTAMSPVTQSSSRFDLLSFNRAISSTEKDSSTNFIRKNDQKQINYYVDESLKENLVNTVDQSYNSEPPLTLESLYAEMDVPVQTFSIDPDKDCNITCAQGTRIFIPKESFDFPEYEDHSMVSLQVQEYYGKEALLMGNLGTVSDDKLLESAGTIRIEAFHNGKNVELKKDKSIELGFPDRVGKEKKGMDLFTGSKDKNGNINWQTGSGRVTGYQPSGGFIINSKYASPSKHFALFNQMLQREYKLPKEVNLKGYKKTITFVFTIDYLGNLVSVETNESLHPEIKDRIIPLLKKLNKWRVTDPTSFINRKKKKVNTDPVTESVNIRFFNRKLKVVDNNYGFRWRGARQWGDKLNPKNNYANSNINLDSTQRKTMEYAFSSNKLGWINCDRFTGSGKPLANVPIPADKNNNNTDYKLVLKQINSIMPAYTTQNGLEFVNIPEGYEGEVLAIRIDDNKIYAGTQGIVVGKPMEKIELKEYSKENLKLLIADLAN